MSKVKDLQRYISQKNTKLIPNISNDILEFMSEYNTYGSIYDAKLQDYSGLTLLDVEDMDDEAFDDIQTHIRMMLYMNKYKYNELYKTLFYEYNPLNNTEWKETQTFGKQVTTDENGERNTDNVYGERGSETVSLYGEQLQTNSNGKREQTSDHGATQTTDVIAARTNQDVMAQQTTTDVVASRTNSDTFGEQTHADASTIDKTTHKSNGYDSATSVPDGEDTANIGERQRTDSGYTDSHTVGGGTDTHTIDAHTDTHTLGGGTDTHSAQAYTDKVTDAAVTDTVKNEQHEDTVTNTADSYTDTVKQYAATDKHTSDEYTNTIERAGNIGVTTSAQLIKEQRGIVDWSFWEVLYNDIIDEICLSIW